MNYELQKAAMDMLGQVDKLLMSAMARFRSLVLKIENVRVQVIVSGEGRREKKLREQRMRLSTTVQYRSSSYSYSS